jgi:predicted  nucleic acid-binding Zn-ribbon protein
VLAELRILLELQEKDRAIQAIQGEIAAFEPELEELDGQVQGAEEQIETARRSIEEAGTRRAQLETKIESFRTAQERRRQRLEWVRGAKEAANLMAELDLGRTVLAREEAEWLRSADQVQEAEASVAEAEQQLEEIRTAQGERREEIAALQAECRDRMAVAERERKGVAERLSKPALTQYERIRRGRAPLALYALHDDACGHCFTAVPMHRRQELQAGQTITLCEACGVIIYNADRLPEG